MAGGHFDKGFFAFFRDLEKSNNRDWFNANKDRYVQHVQEPMLQFIDDLGARMSKINKNFVADPRPAGGSMFRIHRDTRFSKDKTPYKTWAAASFQHRSRAKDRHVPGFYLSLGPGECYGGGGIYHPDPPSLARIRDHIVAKPREWEAVLKHGIKIDGDSLKRAPSGYDPNHPFVEDLKRKDLYAGGAFTQTQVCSSRFLDLYVNECRRVSPLVQFVSAALGLPW